MKLIALFAAFALTATAHAETTKTSYYTSLENCKVIASSEDEANPEIDWFKSVCPGIDKLDVIVEGGDSRSWLGLLRKGEGYDKGVQFYEGFMTHSFGQFPNVAGTKLEWRYHGKNLVALIVRMSGYDAEADKSLSGLVVLRVSKTQLESSCVIGTTTSNREARDIADDLTKSCL